jgi:histidinol-phosphate aminotransferase
VFQKQIDTICEEREKVSRELAALPGVKVWPSETNFILFRVDNADAVAVQQELLSRRILIKCLHKPGSALENCLRVTIGTPDENREFLEQLAEVIG